MLRTIEAIIDSQSRVGLAERVKLASPKRALVTILEDEPVFTAYETAHLLRSPANAERLLTMLARVRLQTTGYTSQ